MYLKYMKIIFLGDIHNQFQYQNNLINNMKKYKNYNLWLEFIYPSDILLLKQITENNKDEILTKILNNLKKNNWSLEYNKNIIKIIEKALELKIDIFPLENEKYSLKSFIKIHGVNGLFFYLNDRISDKIGGCNYRWIKMIKKNMFINKKNQLIFAGKMHKEPIINILSYQNID